MIDKEDQLHYYEMTAIVITAILASFKSDAEKMGNVSNLWVG